MRYAFVIYQSLLYAIIGQLSPTKMKSTMTAMMIQFLHGFSWIQDNQDGLEFFNQECSQKYVFSRAEHHKSVSIMKRQKHKGLIEKEDPEKTWKSYCASVSQFSIPHLSKSLQRWDSRGIYLPRQYIRSCLGDRPERGLVSYKISLKVLTGSTTLWTIEMNKSTTEKLSSSQR